MLSLHKLTYNFSSTKLFNNTGFLDNECCTPSSEPYRVYLNSSSLLLACSYSLLQLVLPLTANDLGCLLYTLSMDHAQKTQLPYCCITSPHRKPSFLHCCVACVGRCLLGCCLETGCITPLFYCCVLDCVYGAVAWQCVDQIHYNNNVLCIKLTYALSGCFQSILCNQLCCFLFCNFLLFFWFFFCPTQMLIYEVYPKVPEI
jgi:hypothetical protein